MQKNRISPKWQNEANDSLAFLVPVQTLKIIFGWHND